ncbi:hypothetical protein JCM6882_006788 [Rhodosporidiobolus microsporus]
MSGFHDAVLGLVLIGVLTLPIVWIAPTFLSSAVDLVRTLFTSLIYLVVGSAVLIVILGTLLIGEKAVRRWKGEAYTPTSSGQASGRTQQEQERFAEASPAAAAYEQRRARRVARESRLEEAAEVVIDKLERTGVGKLLKRKVKGSSSSSSSASGGRGKGAADEVVELSDFSRTAASTAVRRTPPPPLPPR